MLSRLLAYAEREGLKTEPGFARKKINWAIMCSGEGRLNGVIPLGVGRSGRQFDECPHLPQNLMIAGGQTRSQFLIESLQTVALYWKDGTSLADQTKFQTKHDYFIRLLREADGAPYLEAAAQLLSSADEMGKLKMALDRAEPKPKPTDTAAVFVLDVNPFESKDWHGWWRTFYARLQSTAAGIRKRSEPQTMRCVLTGNAVVPVATHPKVTGLAGAGGLGTGDVIAGFDKEAFQSFGLEQAANAATDEATATAYAQTLSRLIAQNGVRLGNAMAVYWFGKTLAKEDDPLAFLRDPGAPESPEPGTLHAPRKLLMAITDGVRPELLDNYYFALVLSGAAGRVMVRDWIEGRFEDLVSCVAEWFEHLEIVARTGTRLAAAPKFLAVAGCLERDLSDVASPLMTNLWHAAITGGFIPYFALTKALLRADAAVINDEPANHARMGLIKAYHVRNRGDNHMKPYMNPEHPEPAYHCGRLLAILARLQRAALGDVGAGVVQRYYGAASQTPALTLGRLISNAKNHLNKLEGGLPFWFEQQIADVMSRVGDRVPPTLDLEQQSLFALGYYQQLAALNAGKQGREDPKNTDE